MYGGVIDVLLALFPLLVIPKLQLKTREKVGLTAAMSLGAVTGVFVVLRVFFQVVQGDFNFDFMVYMMIFAFLEPCVSLILQVVPIFRVFIVRIKQSTLNKSLKHHTSPPTSPMASRDTSVASKPRSRLEVEVWNSSAPRDYTETREWKYTFGDDRRLNDLRNKPLPFIPQGV